MTRPSRHLTREGFPSTPRRDGVDWNIVIACVLLLLFSNQPGGW